MDRTGLRQKLFTRRAAILAGGQITLFAVLAGRLYDLQVLKSDKYRVLAEDNRMNMRLLAPTRGNILDRYGDPLALNRSNYRVLMIAEQTTDPRNTLESLRDILLMSDAQIALILKRLKRSRPFVPVTVAENLSWQTFARLNALLADYAGVIPDVGEQRFYPMGESAVHVVGYVSAVSEQELTGDPVLELPGFRIGKNGVEQRKDLELRGRAGNRQVEVNAYGREIRELERQDGAAGTDVVTTLDSDLQSYVHRRMSDESAAAVIMDIHNGDVLAMASTPAYDPNAFNLGLSRKAWQHLVKHPRTPLINKAVTGLYPPGSTFKMVVAIAALDAGVIDTNFKTYCNGVYKLGTGRFHCWRAKYGGHGHVDLHKGIEQSCDIYFYELARRVGVDRIAKVAEQFGLGEIHDCGVSGIRQGIIPTKAWKQAVIGEKWQLGETLITGIGQGFVLASPLQLAVMTARLANGGRMVKPRLIKNSNDDEVAGKSDFPSLGLKLSAFEPVVAAMDAVVNAKRGTARAARIDEELGRMAGKTGTAQVRRISRAERSAGVKKNKDRPWKQRDHSLFVAYAPVERPTYAASVIVEHGGSGTYAAKITKDLLSETLRLNPSKKIMDG